MDSSGKCVATCSSKSTSLGWQIWASWGVEGMKDIASWKIIKTIAFKLQSFANVHFFNSVE